MVDGNRKGQEHRHSEGDGGEEELAVSLFFQGRGQPSCVENQHDTTAWPSLEEYTEILEGTCQ